MNRLDVSALCQSSLLTDLCYITYDVIWLLWVLVFLKLLIKSVSNHLIQKVEWTQANRREIQGILLSKYVSQTFGVFDQIMQDFLFIAVICFKWWFLPCNFNKHHYQTKNGIFSNFSSILQTFPSFLPDILIHGLVLSWIFWCFVQ